MAAQIGLTFGDSREPRIAPLQKARAIAYKARLDEIVKFVVFNGSSPSWRRELAFTGHDRAGIGTGEMTVGLPRGSLLFQVARGSDGAATRECAGRSASRVGWSGVRRRRRGKIAGVGCREREAGKEKEGLA